MYNRYIPQPDGTYHKRRIPDPVQPNPTIIDPIPTTQEPAKESPQPPMQKISASVPKESPPEGMKAMDFLKRLFPKGLDTGDLMVILLLLLMAGDCQEDKNTALLTLALYLFL